MELVAAEILSCDARPFFSAVGNHSGAERLGENQNVAGLRADVAPDFVRMNQAGDGIPEFQIVIANGMSADHEASGFGRFSQDRRA